jgi:DNA modification methylase
VCALRLGRKFIGVELKDTYFAQATRNIQAIAAQSSLLEECS